MLWGCPGQIPIDFQLNSNWNLKETALRQARAEMKIYEKQCQNGYQKPYEKGSPRIILLTFFGIVRGGISRSMKITKNLWKLMKNNENQWKSMDNHEKLMKITEKQLGINGNQWKSMTINRKT